MKKSGSNVIIGLEAHVEINTDTKLFVAKKYLENFFIFHIHLLYRSVIHELSNWHV